MGSRLRDRLTAIAAIVSPAVAVVTLHRLGRRTWLQVDWSDLGSWLRLSPFEDALAAGLRTVALAGAYWLTLSTALYLGARLTGARRLADLARPFTLPAARRLADRLVAGSLAVSTLAAPLVGLSADRPMPGPVVSSPVTEAPALVAPDFLPPGLVAPPGGPRAESPVEGPHEAMRTPAPSAHGNAAGADALGAEVVVAPGDNLWLLAERRLAATLGRSPSDGETAPYWRAVIEANRENLRSGNPDLIYPGEIVVLPPTP